MEVETTKRVSDILDYWFSIEFLGQDSFDMCAGATMCQQEVKRYNEELTKDKNARRKHIWDFFELDAKTSLHRQIISKANKYHMKAWGNITIYLGKIGRERCIQNLARCLEVKNADRPEKSYDDIAVLSFQLSPNGNYVEDSLSLSAIVWAISKLNDSQSMKLSDYLSEETYKKDVDILEKEFFGTPKASHITDQSGIPQEIVEGVPLFVEQSVTTNRILEILDRIKSTYIDGYIRPFARTNEGPAMQEFCGLKVQFFKDEETKQSYDEDNYFGLSHDYFSNDLKMIKSMVGRHPQGSNNMLDTLMAYISAPINLIEKEKRMDLIHSGDKNDLELFFQEVLRMDRAPIGKWPSIYMPALMQQTAINFATANSSTGVFEKIGKIFSVNGPPGTGKTTLLKEIVASNIVEKAKLLAEYSRPDDAFEKRRFLHGSKPGGGYSQYHPSWYSIKDERINDYSILVTSCNNAAVENITKELPMNRGILDSLKVGASQSDVMTVQIEEIADMFSIEKAVSTETLYRSDLKRNGEYNEIYFSGYAQQLFGEDAWGLVAVPLGKKTNIREFYWQVLNYLHWDFYPSNAAIESRKEKYIQAQKNFKTQLEKVNCLQDQLAVLGEKGEVVKRTELSCKAQIKRLKGRKKSLEEQYDGLNQTLQEEQTLLNNLTSELVQAEKVIEELNTQYEVHKQLKEQIEQQIIDVQRSILDTEKSIGFIARLFKSAKYKKAMKLISSYERKEEEYQQEALKHHNVLITADDALKKAQTEFSDAEVYRNRKEDQINHLITAKEEIAIEIEKIEVMIKDLYLDLKMKKESFNEAINKFSSAPETHQGCVLDGGFVETLLSKDESESAKAQISNPWATDYYNREREKLLYFALQLTREFILSSKCCRENFVLLGQYWGLEKGDEGAKTAFHKEDREGIAAALYQTLFLLVPVISSTFASVGTLFKDVKEPGVIGTLIVDEAGQAQPHMAVGSLYRCRKAIIVGDPKQVEPVVTDDLELFKRTFTDEVYRYYKDKTLSVQRFADILNPFGTYLENGCDFPDWVGCPLVVHRRCISPMYDISNMISYGGNMKQQTLPPPESKQTAFILPKSQWINTIGSENGEKDHYVKSQGRQVCSLLEIAFKKAEKPDLYIISPFYSVVRGIRREIRDYSKRNKTSCFAGKKHLADWLSSNIGTVHTFQGKEANEVIFLLGCDNSKEAKGAIEWVSSNIVNVAVTRAKYRLYVIGDRRAWHDNYAVRTMKAAMDTFALRDIEEIQNSDFDENEKAILYRNAAQKIPSAKSFVAASSMDDNGVVQYNLETDDFISALNEADFLNKKLSAEQLKEFGFEVESDFNRIAPDIKKNLTMGMKLYYLLKPVYQIENNLDASCCGILFCKALELQLRRSVAAALKEKFPSYKINKKTELRNAKESDLMIGKIYNILRNNIEPKAALFQNLDGIAMSTQWWTAFNDKLYECSKKRNDCCHSSLFIWQDMEDFLQNAFQVTKEADCSLRQQLGGIFFECETVKKFLSGK